jgi:hypothetical protein
LGASFAVYSPLDVRVRAFAASGDEAVDPRSDNGGGTEPISAASVLAKFLLEARAVGPEKVL